MKLADDRTLPMAGYQDLRNAADAHLPGDRDDERAGWLPGRIDHKDIKECNAIIEQFIDYLVHRAGETPMENGGPQTQCSVR